MVRFIMFSRCKEQRDICHIYIPIWLDLLSLSKQQKKYKNINLHSNMVRFIIPSDETLGRPKYLFTFQYGQIYYKRIKSFSSRRNRIYIPIWLDLLSYSIQQVMQTKKYLHSNMVRFIIVCYGHSRRTLIRFTFQYGQIYYEEIQKYYGGVY